VVLVCVAQAGGLTLWVKRTDARDAEYSAMYGALPTLTVDALKLRWVAERKMDVDPGLVSLRLVPDTGDKEEPTPADESRATVLNPRKTLAEAGVVDGSWLLTVFISAAMEGELHDAFRSLCPRSVSLSHSPGVPLPSPMRYSRSL
jgi:hypothetical protein